MKTLDQYYLQMRIAAIVFFVMLFGQQSLAQSYVNINFSDNTNKYSLITEVKSITFDVNGGIVLEKTDNSVSTETLTLIKSITLDETSGGGTPLPVELASFTVSAKGLNTELRWKTATELNNAGFEVQRSEVRDQKSESINPKIQQSNWVNVGLIEGSGTTNSPKEYSFTDKNLSAGKYSYRLKQIDHDGKFSYSQEVEINVGSVPKIFALEQNYPNPFNPTTTIGFTIQVSGLTTLKIYDAIGREVAVLVNENLEAGVYHQRSFDASTLASGIYFARLQNDRKQIMKKMVLMK